MNDYQPWSHEPPHEGHAAPPRERLEFHPLADTFPMMVRAGAEFRGLVQSIKGSGLWEAITMHEGMVLDGRNRLLACEEAGVEPRFEVFDDSEMTALEFVLAKNLYRRHLTEGQKAMKAEEMVTTKHGGDRKSLIDKKEIKCSNEHLIDEKVVTVADAAKHWCVKVSAVRRAAFVRENTETAPKIVAAVEAGAITLGYAHTLAQKTPKEQRDAPAVKFAGRTPNPRRSGPVTSITARQVDALSDLEAAVIAKKLLPKANRALEREGKVLVVMDLQH